MNQISLGPFIVCFLTSILLAGYLYLILHKSHSIFKGHIKIIFVMLIIIMVRMLFPINFPFTHTIYSYRLMVVLGEVLYVNIIKDIQIFDILIFAWFLGAIIQLIRYLLKRKKTRLYLEKFILTNEEIERYNLDSLIRLSAVRNLNIAIVPKENLPAIFGIFYPVIILPEDFYKYNDLDFILRHEMQHYHNYDLFIKCIIDLLTAIHWWNPFMYYLRKEFNAVLEFSNDYVVTKSMTDFERISYAESLLRVAKTAINNFTYDLALTENNCLEKRVYILLEGYSISKYKKFILLFCHSVIVGIMMITVLFVVPEASGYDEFNVQHAEQGMFNISSDNAYFMHQQNGYDLYIDDKYVLTFEKIDETMKGVPVYESEIK